MKLVTGLSQDGVRNYYDSAFLKHGWKLKHKSTSGAHYCKADMDASIEFIEGSLPKGTLYYFEMSREDSPIRKTGCYILR